MKAADESPRADPEAHLERYRRTGDPAEFGRFFDATAEELHRVAVALLPDPVAADDAVQETFLTALRLAPRLEMPGRAMPWLVSILRGHVLHARRSHARRRTRTGVPDAMLERAAPSDDGPATDEARQAIESLEEPYRSAALLRWRYGLEPAEIAHVRGESPGTTRSILSRALDRLRRLLTVAPVVIGGGVAVGLDAIRARVMGEASRIAATAGGVGASAAITVGGIVMGKKAIVITAALLIVAVGGALSISGAFRDTTSPTESPPKEMASPQPPSADEKPVDSSLAAHAAAKPGATKAIEGPSATGVVVDEHGSPIAGALVVSIPAAFPEAVDLDAIRDDDARPLGRSTSDAAGGFRVPLRADGRFELQVRAAGRAPQAIADVGDGDVVRVVLAPEQRVAGRVVDATGRPIVGATVRLRELVRTSVHTAQTASAADGAYSLPIAARSYVGGQPVSSFALEFRAEGFAPVLIGDYLIASADGRGVRTFHVTLRRGAFIVGQVLDGETGDGVPDATVRLTSGSGLTPLFRGAGQGHVTSPELYVSIGEAVSGSDGRFRIENVPPRGSAGAWQGTVLGTLTASRDGHVDVATPVPLVPEGATHEATLRMFAAGSITGTVRFDDRSPAPRTPLYAVLVRGAEDVASLGANVSPVSAIATAGDDGTYRIDHVPTTRREPGRVRVYASPLFGIPLQRASGEPFAEALVRAGETVIAPDLVMKKPDASQGVARLRVVDRAGAPVAAAELVGRSPPIPLTTLGRTDAEGRLRLARHPTALAVEPPFAVRARGFAPRVVELMLAASTSTSTSTVEPPEQMFVLDHGTELRGKVLRADGSAAGGAIVSASLPGASPALSAAGRPGSSELELQGEAPPSPIVAWARAEADGTFALADLPAGPFVVVARLARGGRDLYPEPPALSTRRDAVQAGAADLVLSLPKDDLRGAGPVRVQVVDASSGAPVEGGAVTATRADAEAPARSLGAGEWSFGWLTEGPWRVVAAVPGFVEVVVEDVKVANGGEPAPIRLELRRGARVSGRVVGPAGISLASHELRLMAVEGDRRSPRGIVVPLGADGRYEAAGLAPGKYRALVGAAGDLSFGMKPRFSIRAGAFVVVPGGDVEVSADVPVEPTGQFEVGVYDPKERLPFPPMRGFPVPTPEQVRFGASLRVVVFDARDETLADQRGVWEGGYVGVIGGLYMPAGRYRARLLQDGKVVDEQSIDVHASVGFERAQRVNLRPPP